MPPLGFAASNKHDQFVYPYHQKWQSSDILVNQKINIFGYEQHQLARTISPSQTLKLSDFFEDYNGDLIYHFKKIFSVIVVIKICFEFHTENVKFVIFRLYVGIYAP